MDDPLTRAREALDRAHALDPSRDAGGGPAELGYVARVEAWITHLVPSPGPALRLAARAQHLERWSVPREDHPMDRAGYHRWRRAVQTRQGERARAILEDAGCEPTLAARVQSLVAKLTPRSDPDAQALEDAACLVFLETECAPFAAAHPEYSRDKLADIVARTWAKMSPVARSLARTLPLDEGVKGLVDDVAGREG